MKITITVLLCTRLSKKVRNNKADEKENETKKQKETRRSSNSLVSRVPRTQCPPRGRRNLYKMWCTALTTPPPAVSGTSRSHRRSSWRSRRWCGVYPSVFGHRRCPRCDNRPPSRDEHEKKKQTNDAYTDSDGDTIILCNMCTLSYRDWHGNAFGVDRGGG